MATRLGIQTDTPSYSNFFTSEETRGAVLTIPAGGGTLRSIAFYLFGESASNDNYFRVGLYQGGTCSLTEPNGGNRLYDSGQLSNVQQAEGWYTISGLSNEISAGALWIMFRFRQLSERDSAPYYFFTPDPYGDVPRTQAYRTGASSYTSIEFEASTSGYTYATDASWLFYITYDSAAGESIVTPNVAGISV